MFDLYFSFFIYYQKSQRQISDPLVIMTILDITLVYLFFFFLILRAFIVSSSTFFLFKNSLWFTGQNPTPVWYYTTTVAVNPVVW